MRLRNAVLIPVVKHLEALDQNGSTIKKDRLLDQQSLRCLHNLICSSSHNVLHHRGATIGPNGCTSAWWEAPPETVSSILPGGQDAIQTAFPSLLTVLHRELQRTDLRRVADPINAAS
jgi:hypothetical protein